MLALPTLLSLLMAAGMVQSALVPTKPGPNESFNTGAQCMIEWDLDTTGTWTSFSVDLMSGSNLAMQTVMNVFKGRDGTKAPSSYQFTCPDVTPNSAIYFYQFSQNGADTTWTTRFTIASASGKSTSPPNATQPSGQAIPWGVGGLTSAPAANTTGQQTNTASLKNLSDSTNTTAGALNVTTLANATNLNTTSAGSSSTVTVKSNENSNSGTSASSASSSTNGKTTAQTPTSSGSALTVSQTPSSTWGLAVLLLMSNIL